MKRAQPYIELYRQVCDRIKQHAAPLLNRHRDEAFALFEANGFPQATDETYRHSKLMQALDIDYGINIDQLEVKAATNELFKCEVPGIKTHSFFSLNHQPLDETPQHALPQDVIVCSLQKACQNHAEIVERYLGKLADKQNDGFVNFNRAFAQNGWFVYIPQNTQCELPIQFVSMLQTATDWMGVTRNLIVADEGSTVKLLVCDHSQTTSQTFTHNLTEIFLEKNADFQYYTLENRHLEHAQLNQILVRQGADSRSKFNLITLNNGTTRNHLEVDLDASGATCWVGGLVTSDRTQRTDNHTVIRHNAPHCTSHELFKYILDGQSEGIFAGRVVVQPGAQQTEAFQTNRNICLTNEALMHSKPQLEIYTDDVKCGHGATTGQIDENALFYMRTRGIGESEARMMLLLAFTDDVLQQIEVEALYNQLRSMTARRLRGDETKCKGCNIC